MNEMFEQALKKCIDIDKIKLQEEMSKHCSFRVGGKAQYYISVESKEQLQNGIQCCKDYEIPYYVIGNGSNLLISDQGLCGVVFQIGKDFAECEVLDEGVVYAQAGAMLSSIAKQCYNQSLNGFEFAAGIPGSLGGAVYMNAGAYGGEMKDILTEVEVLDTDGKIKTYKVSELQLGYRQSILMERQEFVLSAKMHLTTGNQEEIKAVMDDLATRRREKQPLEYPSAGSTFKRPEGYFAGKLIQDAGLSGYRVGGAMVSTKHCGFVINENQATAQDIYQLTEDVIEKVKAQFGVTLEREVRLLGDFS